MPKKPRITDEQRALVAEQLANGASIDAIRKKTGFSGSSINRIKPDIGAVFMKWTKTQEDVRIQRILRELGLNTDSLVEESLLIQLKQMAVTEPKAAKVLALIEDRDEAMKERKHKDFNLAEGKAARVPEPVKRAIIQGAAKRLHRELKRSSTNSPEDWKKGRDVQEALYRKIKGVQGKKRPRRKPVMGEAQKKRWEAWRKEHDKDVTLYRRLQGISEADKKA
jgi:hypothetical protein